MREAEFCSQGFDRVNVDTIKFDRVNVDTIK